MPKYAVRCDTCRETIGATDSLATSAAGGRCDTCQAATTTRVEIKPKTAIPIEGPSYEIRTDDGPASRWDYFVAVLTVDGLELTYRLGLRQNAALRLAARVEERGSIDLRYWSTSDPWEGYRDGTDLEGRLGPYGTEWEREQVARFNGED